MSENLLDFYALAGVELIKVSAELQRPLPPDQHCQARVELKLTPQVPQGDSALRFGQVIHVRLLVTGLPSSGREEEQLFSLEVALNAIYRPHNEDPGFELFHRAHTSLTRQLFPIVERRASLLLMELGLPQVRLPMDIVHSDLARVTAYH